MSLTAHVDPAIELIEHRFRNGPGANGLAYLRSHAYFNQLSPADACLDSFLTYELDPSTVRPLGGGRRVARGDRRPGMTSSPCPCAERSPRSSPRGT